MRLLLALGVSWLVLTGLACSPPSPRCDASNCMGCCDTAGVCQVGNNSQSCGAFGGQCNPCALGLSCNAGVCVPFGGNGGGAATGGGSGATGGGSATGGGDGSTGGGSATGGGANTGGGMASGPRIAVTPATLAFGQVFTSANPVPLRKTVTIENTGIGNLLLGTAGQQPYFEISGTSEFTAQLSNSYDAIGGLVPTGTVELTVTLLPTSVGTKSATLVLRSNDPERPSVTLALTASVAQAPPCAFNVTPLTATFGIVSPPQVKELAITVTNTGTAPNAVCFVTNVALSATSHPSFSLVGGPVSSVELQPGEARAFVVRVSPTGTPPATPQAVLGQLEFDVSTASGTHVVVPLNGSIGASCLNVVPRQMDFGSVRLGCGSATRAFSIYNSCAAPVSLTSVTLQLAAGQQPGGPACPGAQPCPEFRLTSAPTIPGGGLTLSGTDGGVSPVSFEVRYSPIDVGNDVGAVAINTVENNQTVTTVVELVGRGDATGTQVDMHTQPLTQKADVLLVVDDSCSMQDKQLALGQNFASFIQYATSANVDYRIAVTTTTEAQYECLPNPLGGAPLCVTNSSKGPEGKLVVDTTTQLKWVTPVTPQAAAVFGRLVNVGTGGSGAEAALACAARALTPPAISGHNAGFLRSDAQLAVVVITDASDQSSQLPAYYRDLLVNVKGAQRLSEFTFSAMGPTLPMAPSGCTYDQNGANSQRYQPVIQHTEGVLEEICTTNWSSVLQQLGQTVFGVRAKYTLRNVPDVSLGAPTVRVNGQAVPGCAMQAGCATWFYDVASNTVKFAAAAAPPPGASIEIQYTQGCFAP